MNLAIVRALGWIAIAHGLSQAVLPLRGSLAPAYDINDWMPFVLYAVSMVGFVAAGLGLLGLRPMTVAISPLLVLSSALSLVAIQRLGHADLWFGGMLDVVFFVLGLWRGYAGWPVTGRQHGHVRHVLGLACAFAFLGYVAVATTLWPWHRTWGATRDEIAMTLPGDGVVRNRALEIQHGVTIDAPPERVWEWLVQLGQDRAGFYSYDVLERALGADIHNIAEIRQEWQHREVGEFVPATQPGYLWGLFGRQPGWRISALEPGRAIVLENWGAFVLLPTSDGATRFIIRSTISKTTIPAWAAALEFMTFEIPHFIMERRMMLTIKRLAEQQQLAVARSR
jgi:uncharacterized protein YndB with AHSA1/START domain